MPKQISLSDVGLCGRACGFCRYYQKECKGCRKENAKDPACAIYKCAKKKRVSLCMRCGDMPCALRRSLLSSYCPVYDRLFHKF